MKHRKNIGFDKQRGNFGCAVSSAEKISASTNSVEILVARYQAQKKYWHRQIAWKFWLRVIKHRKNIGFDKQRGNFGCALSSAEKITATKKQRGNSGGSL